MLALALISLANFSSKSGGGAWHYEHARANARLGLAEALAQLQRTMGSDQRISAPADILDRVSIEPRGKMIGSWRSWENHHQYLTSPPVDEEGFEISYDQAKQQRFLEWLVSANDPTDFELALDASSGIRLVGGNSPVYGQKINIDEGGAYAYVVADEGMKANLSLRSPHDPMDHTVEKTDLHAMSVVAGRYAAEVDERFDQISGNNENIAKHISYASLKLSDYGLEMDDLEAMRHEITVDSLGLIVDVNRGGLKQDLSLLAELESTPESLTSGLLGGSHYRLDMDTIREFSNHYKELEYLGDLTQSDTQMGLDYTNRSVDRSRTPVLAGIQMILSYDFKDEDPDTGQRAVGIKVTPVLTLWNPYNVTLKVRKTMRYKISSLPFSLQLKVGNTEYPKRHFSEIVGERSKTPFDLWAEIRRHGRLSEFYELAPGETKIFAPKSDYTHIRSYGGLSLTLGFKAGGGFFWSRHFNHEGQTKLDIMADKDDNISLAVYPDIDKDSFEDWGVAFHMDSYNGYMDCFAAPRFNFSGDSLTRFLNRVDHNDTPNVRVGDISSDIPSVCASMSVRMQSSLDSPTLCLGFMQTNPLCAQAEYGRADAAFKEGRWGGRFSSDGIVPQPLSLASYDFVCMGHPDWNDTYLPQVAPEDRGYVGSGFRVDSGVSVCMMAEVPQRGILSLVELQHCYVDRILAQNHFNFQGYAIGNSIPNPTVPAGSVGSREMQTPYWKSQYTGGKYINYDTSYALNAQLFDRFFYSSIGPRSGEFSATPHEDETMLEVYQAHLNGSKSLPNSRFVALADASDSDVAYLAGAIDTIASKMAIKGAFNVNSTSVLAWKLLLSGLNDQLILQRDTFKGSDHLVLSGGDERRPIVVSRFGVAGGPCADIESPDQDQIPEELFWRGYRALTVEQVDVLAEKVVEQVKLRGPFLSLAEFINRRLTHLEGNVPGTSISEKKLAARGAIQAALDHPEVTINNPLKDSPINRTIGIDDVEGYTDYIFPEGAIGDSCFGAAGWVTQADILKPLVSFLTPRSDTFMIRSYGESTDSDGNVMARAYCEALVQRGIRFVDPANSPEQNHTKHNGDEDSSFTGVNRAYGRQFKVVRFKWIQQDEV